MWQHMIPLKQKNDVATYDPSKTEDDNITSVTTKSEIIGCLVEFFIFFLYKNRVGRLMRDNYYLKNRKFDNLMLISNISLFYYHMIDLSDDKRICLGNWTSILI